MFHNAVEWVKDHKKIVIGGVAILAAIIVVSRLRGGMTPQQAAAQEKFQLAMAKQQISGQEDVAKLQEQAAVAPYSAQTAMTANQDNAAVQTAQLQAGVQTGTVQAELQQALASITGQVSMNANNNATQASINATNNNYQLAEANNMGTLEEWLANLEKTGDDDWEGLFPNQNGIGW